MKKEELLIETEMVKVRVMRLEPGEEVPFHYHTQVTDNMFGLSGEIEIRLQSPVDTVVLIPGSRCEILPGRVHQVANRSADDPSEYLLVQGVGKYDFIRKSAEGPDA